MPARNVVSHGLPNSKVKYSRLATDDDGYIDLQSDGHRQEGPPLVLCGVSQSIAECVPFKRSPPKVPYKAIALATVLFLIGSLLIIIGALLLAGYFGVTHSDRTIPVLIIGILVFLPGIYHLRIAYYAWKGYPGYSYEDIPDFDD